MKNILVFAFMKIKASALQEERAGERTMHKDIKKEGEKIGRMGEFEIRTERERQRQRESERGLERAKEKETEREKERGGERTKESKREGDRERDVVRTRENES